MVGGFGVLYCVLPVVVIKGFEGAGDFACGFGALDAHGEEQDVEAGEAAVGGGQDVVEDVAGAASDDGNALGDSGDGAFAGVLEEAFGLEFFAELAEGEFEASGALGEEGFDVELEFSLGFVEFDGAAGDDGHAVFGAKWEAGEGVFPEDAGEFCAGLLEGKKRVAAVVGAEIGDFSGDIECRGQCSAEDLVDQRIDRAHRERTLWGTGGEGEHFLSLALCPGVERRAFGGARGLEGGRGRRATHGGGLHGIKGESCHARYLTAGEGWRKRGKWIVGSGWESELRP